MAKPKRRTRKLGFKERTLATGACIMRHFDPNVKVPEGVDCGRVSVEVLPGSNTVRVTGDATFDK